MKKWKIAALAILLVIGLVPAVQAKIDWKVDSSFKAETPTLDIATSFDGKFVFVLSPGKVQIISGNGKVEDTLDVDPSMNKISVTGFDRAGIQNKIILSSEKTGEVQQISYSFIVNINTQGSPFLGPANAPVTFVVFSDFQ
jgi:hypothetical protein